MNNKITEQINSIIIANSTIAFHSISGGKKENLNSIEDATSILWYGLNQTEYTEGGLPGNCIITNDVNNIYHNIYAKGETMITVIISIPEVLEDKDKEQWYIGIYPTGAEKYDEKVDTLPINKYIEENRNIPREFIAGLLITHKQSMIKNGEITSEYVDKFLPNKKYIGNLDETEKAKFFENIKEELISHGLKKVNSANNNFSKLDEMFELNNYYLDQLKQYQKTALKR